MQTKTCGFCNKDMSMANYHIDISIPSGYCPICTGCAVTYGACAHGRKGST